ncbi:MAG: LysR family transcriptional regulator [Alphaproteobacteria bacterium]
MSVFVAVAEEAGFAPAARRLSMSPPAVTRAISALEDRLSARLLNRTTRAVSLTDAGLRYLTDCKRILLDIDAADQAAAGLHTTPAGTVSVTASTLFGRMIVTPMLLDLMDTYPRLSVSTLFVDRVVHLMEEGIDVAIRIADLPDSSLRASRVGSMRRVLCAAPDYINRRGRPASPADLKAHDLVDFTALTPGGEWPFTSGRKTIRYLPKARLAVNTADPAISAALAGRGITRVLAYMVRDHIVSGDLEIVLEDFETPAVPVHVVHKEGGQASARVRATVDHLIHELRRHPALTENL